MEIQQQIVNALTLGSVYALFALGYSMVYGILEMLNFAHGEVFMIGGFIGYLVALPFVEGGTLTANPALVIVLMLIAAAVGCSAVGVTIEFLAYRPLRKAARLAPLISALGVSILLQNVVGVITNYRARPYATDLLLPHSWSVKIGSATIGPERLLVIIVGAVALIGLDLFINRTKLGKAMRATSQDREAAAFMGISVNKIISTTFLVGSALAGIGGVLTGLYYTQVDFAMGFALGMKAFTAAVLGGIGNLRGAVLGAFILGGAETFGSAFISTTYKDVIAFSLLIILLLLKPSGLLGQQTPVKV
ncbi:MAG: branched-chain amino acid ABC transporter permease [Thermoleophilia bacterium]|nr:branched-chain amino acid ABC transporter permease [Thermoleophilia bacterium]